MSNGRRQATWCGPQRLRIAACFGLLFWSVLAGRLVQVQGVLGAAYAERAHDQYVRRTALEARRGSLLDRRGTEMATDVEARSFYARPDRVEDPQGVAQFFARLSGGNAKALAEQLRSERPFIYLVRQIDGDRLGAPADSFAGVYSHSATRRFYPLGSLAGQLLGHTDIDNRGREGIERSFDGQLRETDGAMVSYVDARGLQVPGRVQEREGPQDGRSIVVTIDALYQSILEEELARTVAEVDADGAMGVVLDPNSGEILAMANVPLFDPNRAGSSTAGRRRNRAIADAYEPGSTFKVIAAAAVLEDKLARLHERVDCQQGVLKLANGEVIRDIAPHGELSFAEVIENSSNIGLIKFARRLPRARFYQYIRSFGFASRTGVELPAESSGLLQRAERWSERSLETIAIGQEISVTALQLAQAYAAIANGGQLMAPQIVKGYVGEDGRLVDAAEPTVVRRVIGEQTSALMRRILRGVVDRGTGHRAQIAGLSVAGKTGTAQKAAADGRGYDPDASIASFAGFLPAEEPRYVCVVVVDEPRKDKWGGSVAAPVFQRVMERIVHLPGGLLAHAPAAGPGPATITVPDLRGMTRAAARLTAQLRGMEALAEGGGTIVVAQQPDAGEEVLAGVSIRCQMGEDLSYIDSAEELQRRQARLFEVMEEAQPLLRDRL